MENNQQIEAKPTLATGFKQAKKKLTRLIVDYVYSGLSVSDIADKLEWSRNRVYKLLNSKEAQKIIEQAYIDTSALAPKAVKRVDEAMSIETEDPELKLKQSDRAINILYGLGVLKKQTKESSIQVPVADLKGLLQGVFKEIMTNKIEVEYKIEDVQGKDTTKEGGL